MDLRGNLIKKIMLVFGTRPEAIKMAPLIDALKQYPNEFEVLVCITAQHREMLDQVLSIFKIQPDIDLNLMKVGQDLPSLFAAVLSGMHTVLLQHRPDMVLVHGDTSTTLATAMAAFFNGTPIGHVEAGLRTYRIAEPFPEEFNRQVVSKIARWNFAPTEGNRQNLLDEGFADASIAVTGNTVTDALFWVLQKIDSDRGLKKEISGFLSNVLNFNFDRQRFVLITGHRRENFGIGIEQICAAIQELAKQYPIIQFVYPVHLNPHIQEPVKELLSKLENVHLIEPLNYTNFTYLMSKCYLVLTDSGGIQEEAPSLGKPVLVMRDVSERPEAITAGSVRLIGARKEAIISAVSELLDDEAVYQSMAKAINPYGDGRACERIIAALRLT